MGLSWARGVFWITNRTGGSQQGGGAILGSSWARGLRGWLHARGVPAGRRIVATAVLRLAGRLSCCLLGPVGGPRGPPGAWLCECVSLMASLHAVGLSWGLPRWGINIGGRRLILIRVGCPHTPSWGLLGPSWGPLGAIWGPFWALLASVFSVRAKKRSQGHLLRPSWGLLGSVLEPSWGHFGALLGPSWSSLEAILGHLGRS